MFKKNLVNVLPTNTLLVIGNALLADLVLGIQI